MSVNKIKDSLTAIISGDSKKIKIIVAVGLIGIVLIFASDLLGRDADAKKTQSVSKNLSYDDYSQQLEDKLSNLISSIDGVGDCKVMITLENTSESVYATDVEIKNDNSSINQKDEYVFYDSDSGEAPVLIKEYLPKIQGVTVVCTGGDNTAVKEKIIQCVTSLFNIPTNRVSVSKIKS